MPVRSRSPRAAIERHYFRSQPHLATLASRDRAHTIMPPHQPPVCYHGLAVLQKLMQAVSRHIGGAQECDESRVLSSLTNGQVSVLLGPRATVQSAFLCREDDSLPLPQFDMSCTSKMRRVAAGKMPSIAQLLLGSATMRRWLGLRLVSRPGQKRADALSCLGPSPSSAARSRREAERRAFGPKGGCPAVPLAKFDVPSGDEPQRA